MKNENNTQRNSPSSPNLKADNPKGAGEGLDGTACSASSLLEEQVRSIIKKVNNEKVIKDRCWSRKHNNNFYQAALRAGAYLDLPANEFGFSEDWLKSNAEWP